MDPVIEGTSTAEHTESGEGTQIEGTSAAEHTGPFSLQIDLGIAGTSAAEQESGERTQIEGTSAAKHTVPFGVIKGTSATEHTEIEETSAAAEHTESGERMQIKGTSAAAEYTESWEITQWPTNSIFRAPAHIRFGRESNFEPKLVSIGQYYHGQEKLKRMEDLKLRCLPEFRKKQAVGVRNHPRHSEKGIPHCRRSIYNVPVKPSTQWERGIDDVLVEQFMDWGGKARAYYKEEFDHSAENFVRMLVLDSCFIIRTILSLSQQVQESMAFLDANIKEVRSDLLLMENQIPLFFIKKVYKRLFIRMFGKQLPPFNTVLEPFICLDMPWIINHDAMSSKEAAHLLDLYWRCSLSPRMYMELSEPARDLSEQDQSSLAEIHLSNNAQRVIENATELQKMAGIKFEKFKDKGDLDVTFSNGIMRMPRLKIDSRQTILLVNLIAFENCILPSMRTFSCYMKLMDALIDSKEDVKLLQKCGVISNTLSSHEMAATFFNDIGNFCFIDHNTNRFSSLYKDVQKYYDSSWHRRWASLQQNYFRSPWAGISVGAGVIMLFLSAFQTLYTIYGYYKPKN